eukprot:14545417-Alexandrium_andersonii.AAC.1
MERHAVEGHARVVGLQLDGSAVVVQRRFAVRREVVGHLEGRGYRPVQADHLHRVVNRQNPAPGEQGVA